MYVFQQKMQLVQLRGINWSYRIQKLYCKHSVKKRNTITAKTSFEHSDSLNRVADTLAHFFVVELVVELVRTHFLNDGFHVVHTSAHCGCIHQLVVAAALVPRLPVGS